MLGNLKTLALHVAIWVSYTFFAILVYGYGDLQGYVYETSVSYLISATIFYAHASWILPAYLGKKRYQKYLLALIALYGYNLLARNFAFVWYPQIMDTPTSTIGSPIAKNVIIFSWQWCTFMLFSTGYWLASKRIQAERLARAAEQERLQLENAALRAQINPHFLFNTLDSIRIEAEDILPDLSACVTSLIELLRSTFSTPDADGMILLEREMQAINALVSIYRRRFPYIQLQYKKSIPDPCVLKISPHVLLTFVENAFKHGDYTDSGKPIRIDVLVSGGNLKLFTYNKKDYRINDTSRGIGMKFIRRQLDSNYADRYTLSIADNKEDYTVNMKISLQ